MFYFVLQFQTIRSVEILVHCALEKLVVLNVINRFLNGFTRLIIILKTHSGATL